jgi:hypothetical protein
VEADVSDGLRARARALAAPAGILALGLYLTAPLLGCLDECFVDLGAVHGEKTGEFELADTRLLAWILAWVQHSLTDDPASLYDTNAFHPAARTLVGSEHTLGIALLMLPVRLFTSEAIPIYQLALVLSFLLLGATTFLLVRWLTGSEWASFLAAALAMFMPWRVTELSHIQLLHVQWFPLVWLLVARILAGDARRWEAPLLAVALAFQMLSSFYLSYFLLLSVAVLMGALRVFARPPRRALLRLAAAFAPALLLLTLTSIPYLARESAADLAPEAMPIHSIGIANAWHAIAPALRFEWGTIASAPYSVPLGVCLLAAVTLPFAIRRAADPRGRRTRAFCWAMWGIALGAFVMMIGYEVHIAGLEIPLPSRLAALLIPGFSLLRAPFRWGLLIGLAAPVLCGLAIFYLERRFAPSPRTARRVFARITVVVLLAANAGTAPIPVKPAWDPNDRIRAAHEARRGLPPGPLVEIPWPVATLPAQNRESRSLLASARHWQPILNGYTGYPPATYFLLRRTAQRLPERRAIEQLRALADLRFVVVHADLLPAGGDAAWRAAAAAGDVALRRVEGDVRIYEVTLPPRARGGVGQRRRARGQRPRCLRAHALAARPASRSARDHEPDGARLARIRHPDRGARPASLRVPLRGREDGAGGDRATRHGHSAKRDQGFDRIHRQPERRRTLPAAPGSRAAPGRRSSPVADRRDRAGDHRDSRLAAPPMTPEGESGRVPPRAVAGRRVSPRRIRARIPRTRGAAKLIISRSCCRSRPRMPIRVGACGTRGRVAGAAAKA